MQPIRRSRITGRGSRIVRKEKPYQLEDRVEQLFHEKSVTGCAALEPAVRRDHGGRCASRSDGKKLAIEPTLNLLQDRGRGEAQGRRRKALRQDLYRQYPDSSP